MLRRREPVFLQRDDGHPCEAYRPAARLRLRWANDAVEDAAADPERKVFEINVLPLEREQFAVAHPGGHGQYVEGVQRVAPRGLQQRPSLLPR